MTIKETKQVRYFCQERMPNRLIDFYRNQSTGKTLISLEDFAWLLKFKSVEEMMDRHGAIEIYQDAMKKLKNIPVADPRDFITKK